MEACATWTPPITLLVLVASAALSLYCSFHSIEGKRDGGLLFFLCYLPLIFILTLVISILLSIYYAIKCEFKGTWFVMLLPILACCLWCLYLQVQRRSTSGGMIYTGNMKENQTTETGEKTTETEGEKENKPKKKKGDEGKKK